MSETLRVSAFAAVQFAAGEGVQRFTGELN